MARQFGVTDDQIESLGRPEDTDLPENERAALRLAEVMTRGAGLVRKQEIEDLRRFWSEEQIVEMACVIGLFNYLNRFAEALGVDPTQPGEGGPGEAG